MTGHQVRAGRGTMGLAAAVAVSTLVAGCGGGGLASALKDAVNKSTTTASTTTTTTTTTAAGTSAGFFDTIPDATNVAITAKSPATGQAVTLTDIGDGINPETQQTGQRRTFAVAGTPVTVPASGTMHEQVNCSGNGCSTVMDREYWAQVSAQVKKQGTFVPVTFDANMIPTNAATGDIVESRERNLNIKTQAGVGVLASSYYGDYSDVTLTGVLTLTQTANGTDGSIAPSGAVINAFGAFHGGTATSSGEMTALKNSNATASYTGLFEGLRVLNGQNMFSQGSEDQMDARGNMMVNANFGTAKASGFTDNLNTGLRNAPVPLGYGVGFTDATITASTYTGNAFFTNGASTGSGINATGTAAGTTTITGGASSVIGGFYGTNAAETTGSIRVQGTPTGTTGTTNIMGSFGAKKNVP